MRTTSFRAPVFSWLLVIVRVFAMLLVAQTNGVADGVADVVAVFSSGSEAPDDDNCSDVGDCHCPPGCPNCHSSHGVGSLPATATSASFVMVPGRPDICGTPYDAALHPRSERSSIYRPPRSLARS